MNYRTIIASCLASLSALLASAAGPDTYDLKVFDFSELKIIDDINVVYRCSPDSAGHVTFTALPDQVASFIFQPNGSTLELQLAPEAMDKTETLPTVTVYSTYLTRAENDGRGSLVIESVAPGPKLQIVVVGNGRVTAHGINHNTVDASIRTGKGDIILDGKADIAKLSSLGTGSIQADALKARQAKCRITGTGTIGVDASEALSVSGIGSGTVFYLGNPSIKTSPLSPKPVPLTGSK